MGDEAIPAATFIMGQRPLFVFDHDVATGLYSNITCTIGSRKSSVVQLLRIMDWYKDVLVLHQLESNTHLSILLQKPTYNHMTVPPQ